MLTRLMARPGERVWSAAAGRSFGVRSRKAASLSQHSKPVNQFASRSRRFPDDVLAPAARVRLGEGISLPGLTPGLFSGARCADCSLGKARPVVGAERDCRQTGSVIEGGFRVGLPGITRRFGFG